MVEPAEASMPEAFRYGGDGRTLPVFEIKDWLGYGGVWVAASFGSLGAGIGYTDFVMTGTEVSVTVTVIVEGVRMTHAFWISMQCEKAQARYLQVEPFLSVAWSMVTVVSGGVTTATISF